jgi:oxygen-dependent protoporphyrinogen oxidase
LEQQTAEDPILVVGAGISGLSAAYTLSQAGANVVVVDSRSRAGGVMETTTLDGCLVEGGPDSYLSQKPWATALVRKLGLEQELIGSNDDRRKTFIVRDQQLVPMPDGLLMMVPTKILPMVGTRLLSWPTKLRMGLELLRRKPAKPRDGDVSVAAFFRDHYGQEAVDYLAEPLLAGVYGGDPERMSAPSVLGRFVELENKHGSLSLGVLRERKAAATTHAPTPIFRSLRQGMGSFAEALVRAIGPQHLRLGQSVLALEPQRGGYHVSFADGASLQASQVILALPAYAAASLLESMHPLSAKLLGQVPYHSSATVALTFDLAQFQRPPEGFGFLVPQRERQTLVAATYVQNKFPHRTPEGKVLLRCFVGRAAEANPGLRDDSSLVDAVLADLRRLIGLVAQPRHCAVFRWPRAMAQYEVGHAALVRELRRQVSAIPGLHLAGNAFEGIGIPDCVRVGTQCAEAALGKRS